MTTNFMNQHCYIGLLTSFTLNSTNQSVFAHNSDSSFYLWGSQHLDTYKHTYSTDTSSSATSITRMVLVLPICSKCWTSPTAAAQVWTHLPCICYLLLNVLSMTLVSWWVLSSKFSLQKAVSLQSDHQVLCTSITALQKFQIIIRYEKCQSD